MDIVGWRCHYTTNREFASDSYDWRDLPADGVLVVILYFDDFAAEGVRYRKVLDGDDFYYKNPETGEIQTSNTPPDIPTQYVKEGTEISDIAFRSVKSHALSQQWP